jgi:two-component system sensor histidine kinase/response regulator
LAALASARDAGDPFVAAILDMQMPDMDGADLARAIKADETLDRTHLLLMTSVGQRGDARHMEEIGFAAYLVKPTRQSDLFDSLAAVLARSPSDGASQRIVTRHAVHEMRRSGRRILLAEDNLTNQHVAVGILRKLGLGAQVVANGAEALRALAADPYDLVLMDVQMPEMDGLEATRRVRDPGSAVLNHAVPIIAMTAHAMKGDRERCLAAGMDDYVTKPILPEALATALDRWLPREPPDTLPLDRPPGSDAATPDGTAGSGTVVFDEAGMLARLMGDAELARTVIDGFLADVPRLIEALRGCVEQGDLAGALRQAHTIKGASAAVGGEALRAVSAAVEAAATAGDAAGVASRLPDLESAFAQLRETMAAFGGEVGAEAGAQP